VQAAHMQCVADRHAAAHTDRGPCHARGLRCIGQGGRQLAHTCAAWRWRAAVAPLCAGDPVAGAAGRLALGDVTWHAGWTLHCAPPQPPGTPPRLALAVSYFADGAVVLPEALRAGRLADEDAESYAPWLGQLRGGAPAAHALLPLVHQAAAT
jgi:hypothetical protein